MISKTKLQRRLKTKVRKEKSTEKIPIHQPRRERKMKEMQQAVSAPVTMSQHHLFLMQHLSN